MQIQLCLNYQTFHPKFTLLYCINKCLLKFDWILHKTMPNVKHNNKDIAAQVKNITNILQFLIPIQFPIQKQWWSNPSTQWLHTRPLFNMIFTMSSFRRSHYTTKFTISLFIYSWLIYIFININCSNIWFLF